MAYLARHAHRVAIGNSRLAELTGEDVAFRWKDYRVKGRTKPKVMKLAASEFIRRFPMHVLPDGFCRIRHCGLFANGHRAEKLASCRRLLDAPQPGPEQDEKQKHGAAAVPVEPPPCPCCGGRMKLAESFDGLFPRPRPVWRADTS